MHAINDEVFPSTRVGPIPPQKRILKLQYVAKDHTPQKSFRGRQGTCATEDKLNFRVALSRTQACHNALHNPVSLNRKGPV